MHGPVLDAACSGIPNPFGTTGPELAATAAAQGSGIGMGRTPRDSSGMDYFHAGKGMDVHASRTCTVG